VAWDLDYVVPRAADTFETPVDVSLKFLIFSSLLGEEINPKMYDLSRTGVSYSLKFHPHSIQFSFGGFAPFIGEMMDRVLEQFDLGVDVEDETRCLRAISGVNQSLDTFSDMPIKYAMSDRTLLLTPGMHSRVEQQAALAGITPRDVSASVKEHLLSKPMQAMVLAMGNFNETQVLDAYAKIADRAAKWSGFKVKPEEGEEIRPIAPVVRPTAPVEVRKANDRPGDPNDAIVVTYLTGVRTVEKRVHFGVISSLLHTVAYTELRTNKQLGYIVNAGVSAVSNVQHVSVSVQGNKLRADVVEGAIHHVLMKLIPETLKNMTAESLASHKESLKQLLLSPPSKIADEFSHFSEPIAEGGHCFELKQEMLAYLESPEVSQDSLVEAWEAAVLPTDGMREAIVVKHFANNTPQRPTLEETKSIWKQFDVPDKVWPLLEREYNATILLDKADSEERQKLLEKGSYFPTTLYCSRNGSGPPAKETHAEKPKFPVSITTGAPSSSQNAPTVDIVPVAPAEGNATAPENDEAAAPEGQESEEEGETVELVSAEGGQSESEEEEMPTPGGGKASEKKGKQATAAEKGAQTPASGQQSHNQGTAAKDNKKAKTGTSAAGAGKHQRSTGGH
jgi:hypothetical protein